MKNGNQSRHVLGDLRKRYRCPWAEIGKYWPDKEPIRSQNSLQYPLKKKMYFDTPAKIFFSLGAFFVFWEIEEYMLEFWFQFSRGTHGHVCLWCISQHSNSVSFVGKHAEGSHTEEHWRHVDKSFGQPHRYNCFDSVASFPCLSGNTKHLVEFANVVPRGVHSYLGENLYVPTSWQIYGFNKIYATIVERWNLSDFSVCSNFNHFLVLKVFQLTYDKSPQPWPIQ